MSKVIHLKRISYVLGVVFLIAGIFLTIWVIFAPIETFAETFNEYIGWLEDLEQTIASAENTFIIVLVLFMLFFIRASIPIIPTSILCVATALVFNFWQALLINLAGVILLMIIKYYAGVHNGGGYIKYAVRLSSQADLALKKNSSGATATLFLLRLVPVVSLNMVSQLYGSYNYPLHKFLIASVAGYLPRIISYIVVGRNFTNPFSIGFVLPFGILFFISGISLLIFTAVLNVIDLRKQ